MKREITVKCVKCGKPCTFEVEEEQLLAYLAGDNRKIREIFPDLDAKWAEMFISGICPDCWNEIFPPEEDEEEYAEA